MITSCARGVITNTTIILKNGVVFDVPIRYRLRESKVQIYIHFGPIGSDMKRGRGECTSDGLIASVVELDPSVGGG